MSASPRKSGSPPDPASQEGGRRSLRKSATLFSEGLQNHLKARAELLGLETREAGESAARKVILALLTILLLLFAYALLVAAATGFVGVGLERLFPDLTASLRWPLAATTMGAAHLLAALLLFGKLQRKPGSPLFEMTRAELQKDREWLQNKNHRSRNGNDSSR